MTMVEVLCNMGCDMCSVHAERYRDSLFVRNIICSGAHQIVTLDLSPHLVHSVISWYFNDLYCLILCVCELLEHTVAV